MPTTTSRRRRQPPAEETLLDTEEQEEFIDSLRRQFADQTRKSKLVVGSLGAAVAALYLFMAWHQHAHPWGLQHHAAFKGIVESPSIIVAELGAAGTVGAAATAVAAFGSVAEAAWRRRLTVSLTLALFLFGFWATAILKAVSAGAPAAEALWRLAWRPLAPGICVLAAVTAIDELDKVRPELARLEASKYRLKKA